MATYRQPARVLAVTGGKGGVGKSNIAANLALCWAAVGKSVVLFDADMSLGNLDVILNIQSKYNIAHVVRGRKRLEEIIQEGPAGVEVICAASGLEELANLSEFHRQRLVRELSNLQQRSDVIVIDTAAGISKSVVGFCLAADDVLVVTTPEATSMTDAYAMIKVLARHNCSGRISLVVNMAESVSAGRKIYRQIAAVAARFLDVQVYEAGVLLRDERLSTAVRMRKPVVLAYPRAPITASLAALAARLLDNGANSSAREGFFRKVVDWFF